jgi:predicted regulator of Ras-like GTPase activity (Roadblock/LC7/MglB family)
VRPPASTPALALRDLSELTTDVRAAIFLGPDGSLLAAAPERGDLGERLRELTLAVLEGADAAGAEPPAEVEIATRAGAVYMVRGEGSALAVVAGRFTLSSLMRYDLRRMLADLGEGSG